MRGTHNRGKISAFNAQSRRLRKFGRFTVYAHKKSTLLDRTIARYYRAAYALLMAAILVTSFGLQLLGPIIAQTQYKLDPAAIKLLGDSREDTRDYLTLNTKDKLYAFEVPEADQSKGASQHGGRVDDVYSTTLSVDPSQGITYTDTLNKIDIMVTPKFTTGNAKKIDGDHIIYPAGGAKLAYTHKYNGLKEDIIVPQYSGDQLNYSFEISLPTGVEARTDSQGNINIYSADRTLYGNIQFGSDDDRARVDKAREDGAKNNLVATIPAPIVKDASGKEYGNRAVFHLSGNTQKQTQSVDKSLPAEVQKQLSAKTTKNTYKLAIVANNLKDLAYPLSVDPTIQSQSASDLSQGNMDGTNPDITNSLVRRETVTGGTIGAWATDTTAAPQSGIANTVVYGKYIYHVGANTYYAQLNDAPVSGSMIGAWTITNKPTSNPPDGVFAYNGYMYSIIGGATKKASYAKINSNGSIGTWTTATTSFTTTEQLFAATAYNGFIYVIGGEHTQTNPFPQPDTQVADNEVSYAAINADGSTGTWSTTTSMNNARRYAIANAYKGFMYVHNGNNIDDTTVASKTEYAAINADGTIGSWTVVANISGHGGASGAIYNGYLYMWGFWDDGGSAEYAPINADGSLGAFKSTTAFSNGRGGIHNGAIYNGYLFVVGGFSGSSSNINYTDIKYSKIDPAGANSPVVTEANSFTTARATHVTAVINGYIYVVGGCTVIRSLCDTNAETTNSVYYAQINATTGAIGSWASTSGLPAPRGKGAGLAYNNYLYFVGGNGNCGSLNAYSDTCADVYYVQPNSDGTLPSWSTGTALSQARALGALAAAEGRIYYLGGRTPAGVITNTISASGLNSSTGANGSWFAVTALPETLELLSATTFNGYMYAVGGYDGNNSATVVRYIQILSTGLLGASWTDSGTGTGQRDGGMLQVYKGYLYYMGGFNGTANGVVSTIEYGRINSDGSVDNLTLSGSGLAVARHHAGVAVYNGRIYLTGGGNASNNTVATTDSFIINNGGSGAISAWNSTTALPDPDGLGSLTAARNSSGAAAIDGCMFIAGGTNGGTAQPTVQSAVIAANGTLGAWSTQAAMPTYGLTRLVAYNGYLYAYSSGTAMVYIPYVASTCSTSGSWLSAPNIVNARNLANLAVYKGVLYVTGGQNGSSLVTSTEYSVIGANGLPGSWVTGTSMNYGRARHASIVYNGYLYVVSGCYDSSVNGSYCTAGTDHPTSVESAQILSSGALGSWTLETSILYGALGGSLFASNGFMYYMGGISSVSNSRAGDYAQVAPILPNGSLGNWSQSTMRSTSSYHIAHAQYNGYFYLLAGVATSNGGSLAQVDYTIPQVLSLKGTYSRLLNFEKGVRQTEVITRGSQIPGSAVNFISKNVNNTAVSFINSRSNNGISYTGAYPVVLSLGTNVTLSQYLYLSYTLDDSTAVTFPDSNGGQTTITSYDVYYTAAPSARLKGGKTFTGGQNRGLEAN